MPADLQIRRITEFYHKWSGSKAEADLSVPQTMHADIRVVFSVARVERQSTRQTNQMEPCLLLPPFQ